MHTAQADQTPEWEFRLLGPLEVRRDGDIVAVPARMLRALLVALLLQPGEPVGTDRLTAHLWGSQPPASARATLRNYVKRLRALLEPGLVGTAPTGYLIQVPADRIDLHRFHLLSAQGLRAESAGTARTQLADALRLWRGKPFDGLEDFPLAAERSARLTEQHLQVVEAYADAVLTLGDYQQVLPTLAEYARRHPLRERLVGQWMAALHLAGRRSDALRVYRDARKRLVTELGVEPGEHLRRRHQQLLADERADESSTDDASAGESISAPAQLPMDIAEFTGRDDELHTLRTLAAQRNERTAPRIAVITGMPGVGKTRLAVRSAHQVLREGLFPDLQLWMDLRGYDADQQPVDPANALERFLRLLGLAAADLPSDVESRAALYRDRLSGKRALVLLDNVESEDQVRPLLPASPECLVLLTSRRTLTGLDGAHIVELATFGQDQSLALLSRIAGEVIDRDGGAATTLGELCGHLPLAVALAGRRLQTNPSWTTRELVERIKDRDRRLDRLSTSSRSLRAVFDLSYLALPPERQEQFRLLSLHPGRDITAGCAGALAGIAAREAETLLEELAEEHLLQQLTPGRFTFHDLVKPYVRERASAAEEEAAIRRLLAHYTTCAGAARRLIAPHLPSPVEESEATQPFDDRDDALRWCETERDNLIAATRVAISAGNVSAWHLPAILMMFYYLRSHWADWLATHEMALGAVREHGDRLGEAVILRGLGVLCSDLRRSEDSVRCHEQAQLLFAEVSDHSGMAWNLNNLGVVLVDLDRLDEADTAFAQALRLFRDTADTYGEGICLNNLGDTHRRLGAPALASRYLTDALEVQRALDDRAGLRYTLASLGDIHRDAAEHGDAIDRYREAVEISSAIGDQRAAARVRVTLAESLLDRGAPRTSSRRGFCARRPWPPSSGSETRWRTRCAWRPTT